MRNDLEELERQARMEEEGYGPIGNFLVPLALMAIIVGVGIAAYLGYL